MLLDLNLRYDMEPAPCHPSSRRQEIEARGQLLSSNASLWNLMGHFLLLIHFCFFFFFFGEAVAKISCSPLASMHKNIKSVQSEAHDRVRELKA